MRPVAWLTSAVLTWWAMTAEGYSETGLRSTSRLSQTFGLAYRDAASLRQAGTEVLSTPRARTSVANPDSDVVPLRSESRLSYYQPATTPRKPAWPFLRGRKRKRQGSKLARVMERLSEQSIVLTVDSFASEKAGDTQLGDGSTSVTPSLSGQALTKVPTQTPLSRPPTLSEPAASGRTGNHNGNNLKPTSAETGQTDSNAVLGTGKENSASTFPERHDTRKDSLDMYDDLVERSPFRPCRTWSTVPTTDEWVDDAVESLDALQGGTPLSRSASRRNWMILQESPVLQSREAAVSGALQECVSSVRLPQAREQEGNKTLGAESPGRSRPMTATGPKSEMSGLSWKSQSKGVSLRSEGSKAESDYAVFI